MRQIERILEHKVAQRPQRVDHLVGAGGRIHQPGAGGLQSSWLDARVPRRGRHLLLPVGHETTVGFQILDIPRGRKGKVGKH